MNKRFSRIAPFLAFAFLAGAGPAQTPPKEFLAYRQYVESAKSWLQASELHISKERRRAPIWIPVGAKWEPSTGWLIIHAITIRNVDVALGQIQVSDWSKGKLFYGGYSAALDYVLLSSKSLRVGLSQEAEALLGALEGQTGRVGFQFQYGNPERSAYLKAVGDGRPSNEIASLLETAIAAEKKYVEAHAERTREIGARVKRERTRMLSELSAITTVMRGIAFGQTDPEAKKDFVENYKKFETQLNKEIVLWDFRDHNNEPRHRYYIELFVYRPQSHDPVIVTVRQNEERKSATFTFSIESYIESAATIYASGAQPTTPTATTTNPTTPPTPPLSLVLYPFIKYFPDPGFIFGANRVQQVDEFDGRNLPKPATAGKVIQFLLITGRGILAGPGGPRIESLEPGIRYMFLAAKDPDYVPSPEGGSTGTFANLYGQATSGLTAEAAKLTTRFDGILVRADIDGGILPGVKRFRVNGIESGWLLDKGTASAALRIVRSLPQRGFESTNDLFVFDSFQVEIRTTESLSAETVRVEFMRGDAKAQISNGPILARKDPSNPRIYRTAPIYVDREGADSPLASQFSHSIKLKAPIVLTAISGLDREFEAPPAATARVSVTPANVGALWKDALREAAQAAGVEITDWDNLSSVRAGEISKFIWTELGTRKVRIDLGHLAAMRLLRKVFIQEMENFLAQLPENPDRFPLGTWRRAIQPYMQDPAFAIGGLWVGGGITDIYSWTEFRNTFDRDYIARRFGGFYRHEIEWIDKSTREAYIGWRKSISDALNHAKSVDVTDPKAMVELSGQSFEPVVALLIPRLMKLEETRNPQGMRWVPDMAARAYVESIASLATEVRANTELAAASRNVVLSLASLAFFGPATLATRIVCAAIAAGFAAESGVVVYDYFSARNELKFAEGASAILGEDRVSRAQARLVPVWAACLSVVGAALGMGAETMMWVQHVNLTRALARGTQLVETVEKGGLRALQAMSMEDRAAFLALVTEAKSINVNPLKTLTPAHRKALLIGNDLERASRAQNFLKSVNISELGGVRSSSTVEKGDFRSRVTVAEKMPEEGMPEPNTTIQGFDTAGRSTNVELGSLIGKGMFSHVYEIKGMPNRVLKVAQDVYARQLVMLEDGSEAFREVLVRSGADSVRTAQRVHGMLKNKGIAQLEIFEFHPNAPKPYLIQDRITTQMQRFDLEFGNVDVVYNGRVVGQEKVIVGLKDGKKLTPAMQRALLRLFKQLGSDPNPLVWEDAHLENICFKQVGARWEAMILDQDRIGLWNNLKSEPSVLARVRDIEARPSANPLRIRSLRNFKVPDNYEQLSAMGKGIFPSADFFMEKMLEYGGRYIRYNTETKQFEGILLDMKIVEEAEFFPNIRKHVDIDLSGPVREHQPELRENLLIPLWWLEMVRRIGAAVPRILPVGGCPAPA